MTDTTNSLDRFLQHFKMNKSKSIIRNKKSRRLICAISVAFVLLSGLCGCKNDESVGLAIRPDVDNIIVCADTFVLDCENYAIPSISAQADTMVLGEFYSPTYGTTKAELLLQLNAPDNYEFPDDSYNPQPDSLVLLMFYDNYFGSPYSPLEFSIYEINKKPINYTERYYSDLNPGDYCDSTILMGKRVMTSIDLSRRNSEAEDSAEVSYVRYKFDQSQANRFFNIIKKNPTISSEDFLNDFKGIYITTRYGSSTLIYFNQVTMYLYYHYTYKKAGSDTTISTSIIFPANHEVRQLNHFIHPDREEIINNIPDSLLFIKSVAGIYPRMTLPLSKIRKQFQTKINLADKILNISAAEISLEAIEYDETDVYMNPPSYLLAIDERKLDDFLKHHTLPEANDIDRVFGTYNSASQSYIFDFTFLLTKRMEMSDTEDEDIKFVVVPVEVTYSGDTKIGAMPLVKLGATKVRSAKNEYSPLRLKVLYEGF